MSVHSDFILAPVSDILRDTSTITHSMNRGIEMYPLWDNIMQSIFMKMTGAQEQKMKCICWEIATIDFDLRRDIYIPWKLNECSQIDDKRKVLKYLRDAIVKLKKDFDLSSIDTNDIWSRTKDILDEFHTNTSNMGFCEREYQEYVEIFNSTGGSCLDISAFFRNCNNCTHKKEANKPFTCTIKKGLNEMYDCLYLHRNRCAHNLTSYQQNRPSLEILSDIDSVYQNYYIRFALLMIIDKMMISLYRIFQHETDHLELFQNKSLTNI